MKKCRHHWHYIYMTQTHEIDLRPGAVNYYFPGARRVRICRDCKKIMEGWEKITIKELKIEKC